MGAKKNGWIVRGMADAEQVGVCGGQIQSLLPHIYTYILQHLLGKHHEAFVTGWPGEDDYEPLLFAW